MTFIDIFQSNISIGTTVIVILQILLYVIGVIINTKIVFCCWKTRENNKSWQLHILYSISFTIIYAFNIPFVLFTSCIPHLSIHTGEWMCYLAMILNSAGLVIIRSNSFMVAITKYIFVVHWDKALAYGHEKVQSILLTISVALVLPAVIANPVLKMYNNDGPVHICFGTEHDEWKIKNASDDLDFFWRISERNATKEQFNFAHVALLQCFRGVTYVFYGVPFFSNLPEAFFYYKIFQKMIRSEI